MRSASFHGSRRISVMIPTFNYGHYIPRAIESVLAQTCAVHEVIVADDGSTDQTPEIVQRYPRVKYKRFAHAGVYAVRTAILPSIQGEWYLNLDADNWLDPDFCARMQDALETYASDDRMAFFYPDVVMHGENAGLKHRPEFNADQLKLGNYLDMNALIRSDVARRFGFDPAFNSGQGDYDFFITLVKNGYRGCRVPRALLHYEQHGDSISRQASRKRHQIRIMRKIVRKHQDFFSSSERRCAIAEAANRLLVSVINGRSPYAGIGTRIRDLAWFMRAGLLHAECPRQWLYTVAPKRYLAAQQPVGGVYYLFRDTVQRRALLKQVETAGVTIGGREQLFGYDILVSRGVPLQHNLRYERVPAAFDTVIKWQERHFIAKAGIGRGDVRAIEVHRHEINRASCVFATTDNVGLPVLRAASAGRIISPIVYVSIGWPERIRIVRAKAPHLEADFRRYFLHASQIIAYGHAEALWLQQWLANQVPVSFIPFGVDTTYWSADEKVRDRIQYDVISVGADFMRDYELFLAYARAHPSVRCALIAGKENAPARDKCPPNVVCHTNIPVEETKAMLLRSRAVALPVKENTYSGGTTTLLQAMALGCPVAVSCVGAIAEGYGLIGDQHICWMTPGDQLSFNNAVNRLLTDSAYSERVAQQGRSHVITSLTLKHYADKIQALLPLKKTGEK